MDDTGATYPAIHATELALLDVQEDYLGWGFPIWFDTANDPVRFDTLWLDVALADIFADDFPPLTPYQLFLFAVMNQEERLGGPLLRSFVHQGTLPDGRNRIAISSSRTGVVNVLREHAHP